MWSSRHSFATRAFLVCQKGCSVTTKTPSSVPEESVIIQPIMWAKHILILTHDYVLSACSFERLVRFKLSCLVSGFNCWDLWLRTGLYNKTLNFMIDLGKNSVLYMSLTHINDAFLYSYLIRYSTQGLIFFICYINY